MKFENTCVWGFEHAMRGMRNPKNSWNKNDTIVDKDGNVTIGPNDLKLAQTLIRAGSEHRKFMRQIFVSVDITAPLYYWKEFSTYKVGTVENSTSTMHKLDSAQITLDCFEIDDYNSDLMLNHRFGEADTSLNFLVYGIIGHLECLRKNYLETGDKRYWKELVRWLPEGWLQKRTVTMNYENIFAMCHQRENHKLNEWSGKDNPDLPNFIAWAHTLPYAEELIFLDTTRENPIEKAFKKIVKKLEKLNPQTKVANYLLDSSGILIYDAYGNIRPTIDILTDISNFLD